MPFHNHSSKRKPSVAHKRNPTQRDPCSCPEVRAYILSTLPKNAKKPFNLEECLACRIWTCGYVLVDGIVHYRSIVADTLSFGKRVPKEYLTKNQISVVSRNEKGHAIPYGITEPKKPSARTLRDRARRLRKKGQ